MTDYKKQMSRGTTKHVKSFSNEIKIDEQMNELQSQRQSYTKARNIDSERKTFSSTKKQFHCRHDARNYKSRPKTSKQFQGNSFCGKSSYVKDKQPIKQDDKLKKYKNHGNVTRIVKCNFNTKLEQTLVNLKGHASAPDLLKSTKPKVTSSIPISYSSSATQECQYLSGTYKPESGIHTSMSKQKSNRNNSGRQKSSKEVDLAVKITRSEIRRSKNMSVTCNDKNLSTRKSGNSSCEELSKQHVIRTMESQLDDGTTTSLRRYALYRSMINRLSDFLSNKQNQVSNNSGEPTENAGLVPPWDHDDDMYDKLTAHKSPKPKPIARVVSEPDIAPNKWDLMGTYFPKRIYIRETVNGCVIDEVVDVKDEKDWDILTYMSPLRHIDVTHRCKGKPRDLSFADLKDFETYTYAYPWKLT